MKKAFMFLAAAFLSLCSSAQVINGDLDEDNDVTMNDAVLLVNDYVSNTRHYVKGAGSDPFAIDNSAIVGTWWKSKSSKITFNADGTTDFGSGYTYKFTPGLGTILFYNAEGAPIAVLEVLLFDGDTLVLSHRGSIDMSVYGKTQPVQPVTNITLSATTLSLAPDGTSRLTATVSPSDADNKSIVWTSSNEEVASVINGLVVALASGTATITATAQDGSGVKATCTVTVSTAEMHNGHEYVDLGTGVKWATMNVGASTPDDYGDYFSWGETTGYKSGKTTFDQSTYKWCNDGSYSKMTKYSTSTSYWDSSLGTSPDNKKVLDPEDDAAHVNWGGNWRMPTTAEQDALLSQCYWQWVTTYNGKSVKGYIVYKAKADADNGKKTNDYNNPSLVGSYSLSDPHIFLPAAGYRYDSDLYSAGSDGGYWSSSLYESYPFDGCYLYFISSLVGWYNYSRCSGRSVRAVCQ